MNRENERLKSKILDLAIRGKLVPQDINDEPASVLLERIRKEREKLIAEKKIKQEKYSEIYRNPTDNHYYEKFEDGTINDITEEIPFEIPDSWRWEKFDNVFNIVNGFTPLKSKKEFWNSPDISWFTVEDYNKQGYEINYTSQYITNQAVGNNFNRVLPVGTVIICCTASIGIVALTNIPLTTNQQFNGLVKKKFFLKMYNNKFIYYYCLTLKKAMLDKAGKTTFPFLSVKKLSEFYIPLPPIEEQNRIVEKLKIVLEYLNKKDNNEEKLFKLKRIFKSKILDKAIQGKLIKQDFNDESAEILINKILDEKRALIKSKEIKKENLSVIYKNSTDNQFYEKFDDGTIKNVTEEIPFEIPDSWCWTRLENLTTKQIKRGKSPKYTEKSSVYVFSQKCNQKNGKINLENAKFLDETTLKKYNDSDYIMESDIVINSTGNGTLGRVGIIRNKDISSKKIVPDSHITLIRLINEVESNYIFYFLKSNQKYLESQATGSTNQTELSSEIIKKLLIPLSPEKESIMISEKIEKLFNIL